jgi:RNA polymerase sigma factor (sigma-70 family)
LTLSPSQIKTVRHQFDSFCKKVLREESRDYERQLAHILEREITFSDLSESILSRIGVMDEYPSDHTYFDVLDYRVAVRNNQLAKALASLPSKKRDVVLLAFFLDMNDAEIAEKFNVVRTTIQRRRTSSLAELKSRLEVKKNGKNTKP